MVKSSSSGWVPTNTPDAAAAHVPSKAGGRHQRPTDPRPGWWMTIGLEASTGFPKDESQHDQMDGWFHGDFFIGDSEDSEG